MSDAVDTTRDRQGAVEDPASRSRERPVLRDFGARLLRSWIVRSFLGAAMVLVVLAAVAYAKFGSLRVAVAYLNGERLIVYPIAVDFGEGKLGEERRYYVTFANHTGRAVRIQGAHSSCVCLTTERMPLNLASGETRELEMLVRLGPKPGEFKHHVTFYTDYDTKPVVSVWATGNVITVTNLESKNPL